MAQQLLALAEASISISTLALQKQLLHVYNRERSDVNFISHPFRKRIVPKKTAKGRFFSLLKLFRVGKSQPLDTRIAEIDNLTLAYFNSTLKSACQDFTANLRSICRSDPEDRNDYRRARSILIDWTYKIAPALQLFKDDESHPFKEIFESKEIKRIKFYQAIIDLEESTQYPIPFPLLVRLSTGLQLNEIEELAIKRWITHLHDCQKTDVLSPTGWVENRSLTPRKFHRFCYTLTAFINDKLKTKIENDASLAVLEGSLWARGCEIFFQTDAKQIQNRPFLVNQTFTFEDEELTIGNIIENTENQADHPMVFAIENNDDLVAIAYRNEALSFLDEFREACFHKGIPLQKVFSIEGYGEFVIAENITHHQLKDVVWETKTPKLSIHDKENARPIAKFIKRCMNKLKFTPFPLNPHTFGYAHTKDNEYVLRTQDCLFKAPKSYESYEQFAFDAAQENPFVFSYIMQRSGLSKKMENYHELFIWALKNKNQADAVNQEGRIGQTEELKLKMRTLFFTKVQELERDCIEDILSKYLVPDEKKLSRELKEFMIELYKEFSGSILPPTFEAEVIHRYLTKHQLQLQKRSFIAAKTQAAIDRADPSIPKKSLEAYGIYDRAQVQKAELWVKENKHLFRD